MNHASISDKLNLSSKDDLSTITKIKIEERDYAPLMEKLQPKIEIARCCFAVALAIIIASSRTDAVTFYIFLALVYLAIEFMVRDSMKISFILDQIKKESPVARVRNGSALLCHDLGKIVAHESGQVRVIPACLIESAKVRTSGVKTVQSELLIKLYSNEEWLTVASGVSAGVVDEVRKMNPELVKRKWWQL